MNNGACYAVKLQFGSLMRPGSAIAIDGNASSSCRFWQNEAKFMNKIKMGLPLSQLGKPDCFCDFVVLRPSIKTAI